MSEDAARMVMRMEQAPNHVEPPWDDIDEPIRDAVRVLWEGGCHPYYSCQGGPGHVFPCPTIVLLGDLADGPAIAGTALRGGLRPISLSRTWSFIDGEMVGPSWELMIALDDVETWDQALEQQAGDEG